MSGGHPEKSKAWTEGLPGSPASWKTQAILERAEKTILQIDYGPDLERSIPAMQQVVFANSNNKDINTPTSLPQVCPRPVFRFVLPTHQRALGHRDYSSCFCLTLRLMQGYNDCKGWFSPFVDKDDEDTLAAMAAKDTEEGQMVLDTSVATRWSCHFISAWNSTISAKRGQEAETGEHFERVVDLQCRQRAILE